MNQAGTKKALSSLNIKTTEAESLDDFLKRIIAEQDGITPEEVTPEYIRKRQQAEWYKRLRYEIGSDYGGYETSGLKFYTQEELDEMEKRVDDKFAGL